MTIALLDANHFLLLLFWDVLLYSCLTNFGHDVRYIILETFFYSGSLSFDIYRSQTSRRAGRPILTPFYHIHPFHEHLNISWAIIAARSSLHISSGRTRTGNLWFLSQVVNQIRFKYIRKMIDCSINEYYRLHCPSIFCTIKIRWFRRSVCCANKMNFSF